MTIVVDGIAKHPHDAPTYSLNRETMESFALPSPQFLESFWKQGGRANGLPIDFKVNGKTYEVSVHPV
jgi:hypothetical protein